MKKTGVIVLSIVLVFAICLPMPVAASSHKYDISELGLEVTIPEGYAVITRDTPAGDPVFNALGTTKTAVISQFEASNIYLDAISDSANEEIVVTMIENIIDNFTLLSDTVLNAMASMWVNECSEYGMDVIAYEIYPHSQAKFIKIYFTDVEKTVYGLQYYTVYDSKAINFTMRSYEGSISSRQETAIKTTVDSILFDKAPPVVEPGEDTDPFPYTDNGSGVTFTVPANWKQEAFSEDREFIDAKFVSTKEDGCSMIYGSVDMWEEMSVVDRLGYTRSQINNSVFTKAEIAQMYGITVDKISTVTYNGVEYFKGEINASSDSYGIEISLIMTHLVRIDNGWMYVFEFSGTGTHKLYSDFEKLLNSVKYPTASGVEDTEPSKQTAPSVGETEPSRQIASGPNLSNQNSSKASKGHGGVIAVVVLLVIVPAIVVAVVVTRKKNTETFNQPDQSISGNAPVIKPVAVTEPVITCRQCGRTLPSDSVFCHMCGTKIEQEIGL